MSTKNLNKNIPNSFIQNSQKRETIQLSINRAMDKQIVV